MNLKRIGGFFLVVNFSLGCYGITKGLIGVNWSYAWLGLAGMVIGGFLWVIGDIDKKLKYRSPKRQFWTGIGIMLLGLVGALTFNIWSKWL